MTGITKRAAPISWRPSDAARVKLARLVSETKLSRNELLNRAIAQYRENVVASEEVLSRKVEPTSGASAVPQQVHIHKTVESGTDPLGVENKAVTISSGKAVLIEPVVTEPLDDTRAQQERMDDFYRANMAKGKK